MWVSYKSNEIGSFRGSGTMGTDSRKKETRKKESAYKEIPPVSRVLKKKPLIKRKDIETTSR